MSQYLFNEVSAEWLEFHKGKVKLGTYKMYERYVKYLNIEFDMCNIKDITQLQVQKFFNNLLSLNYAKSTISKYRLTLSQIIKYGIKSGYLSKNCCEDTYVPKSAKTKKVTCINDNEIKIILQSDNLRFGSYALFLLYFGLRKSEALALTWEDIDLDKGFLSVNKVLEYNSNKPTVCHCLKNGDEERIVPILPMALPFIKKHKKNKNGIIFNVKNEYLNKSRAEHEWNKYKEITGLNISQHQLRHTYATMLYKAGIDMKTAMSLLGHKDISMIMKVYTHTDEEILTQSANKLNVYMEQRF